MIKKLANHVSPAPISQKAPPAGGSPIQQPASKKPSLGSFVGPKISDAMKKAIGNLGPQISKLPPPITAKGPSLAGKADPTSQIRFPQLMHKLQGSLDKISKSGQPLPPQFDKIKGLFQKLSDAVKMNPMRGGGIQGHPMMPRKPATQNASTTQNAPATKTPFKGPMMDRNLLHPHHGTKPEHGGTIHVRKLAMRSHRPQDGNTGSAHENGNGVNTFNGGRSPATRTPHAGNTPETLTNPTSLRIPGHVRAADSAGTPPQTSRDADNSPQRSTTEPNPSGTTGQTQMRAQVPAQAQIPAQPEIAPTQPQPVLGSAKALPTEVGGKGEQHTSAENNNPPTPSTLISGNPQQHSLNGSGSGLAGPTNMPGQINGKGAEHTAPGTNTNTFNPPTLISPNPPSNGGSLWDTRDLSPHAGSVNFGARPDSVGGQGELHSPDATVKSRPDSVGVRGELHGPDTATQYNDPNTQNVEYAQFERDFFSLLKNLSGSGFFSI